MGTESIQGDIQEDTGDALDLISAAKLIAERLDEIRISIDALSEEVFEIKGILNEKLPG